MSCSSATGLSWGSANAPALALGLVFVVLVVLAIGWDIRHRRIPNALSLALFGGGVLFSVASQGVGVGVRASLAGMAVGLGLWVVFYALGVMGAGDVKFFAAASSWLGPGLSWRAAVLAALLGGVLATWTLLRTGRFGRALKGLALLPFTRTIPVPRVTDLTPAEARAQLPYGVALGLGALLAFLFPRVTCGVY